MLFIRFFAQMPSLCSKVVHELISFGSQMTALGDGPSLLSSAYIIRSQLDCSRGYHMGFRVVALE